MVTTFLLVVSLGWADVDKQPAATHSLPEIKETLLNNHRRIRTLRVHRESDSYKTGLYPEGAFSRVTFVAKSPYFLFHDSAHGTRDMKWEDDPYRQVAYINATHVSNVYSLDRSFFCEAFAAKQMLPGSLKQEFFFVATGIWPLHGREPIRPAGDPYMLFDIANAIGTEVGSKIKLRPRQEKIEGRWCHVIENSEFDRLWIDMKRNGCLVKRELDYPGNGALMSRYILGEHHETSPEIWMPKWIKNVQFDAGAADESSRDRVLVDSVMKLVSVAVNEEVADATFEYEPQAGDYELFEMMRDCKQVVPGGLDHLERMAAWIQAYASSNGNAARTFRRTPKTPPIQYLMVALIVGIVVINEVRIRRSRTR